MAWNRSHGDGIATIQPVKKTGGAGRFVLKGLLAGLFVAGTAALWLFMHADSPHEPSAAGKTPKPAPVRTKIRRIADPIQETGNTKLDARIRQLNAVDRTVEVEVAAANESPEKVLERVQSTKRVFSSGVEQLMSLMFTCKPGNMPFPLIKIDENDYKNLASILVSRNEIEEGDSDSVRYCKETVMRAKKEMMAFIRQGGDPDDFMAYYHGVLLKDFNYRNEALSLASETYEQDPALAADFVKSVNEKFANDGILPISMSDVSNGEIEDDPTPNEQVSEQTRRMEHAQD